jgi:carbon storage regulator CsrA
MKMEIGSLVFARRLNEAFTIYTDSGDIVVSIKEISATSKQVRLCIKAPKNIRIMRDDAVDVKPSHMLFTPTIPKSEKK